MGPSRTLVHAGLRTPARPGWRTGTAAALVTVAQTPSLWLLGALGFLVRGGLLVLVLPVLVLPSPVALRLMVGDNLTSSGFTPGFYLMLLGGAVLLVGVVLAGLAVASHVEAAAFVRLRGGRRPITPDGLVRRIFTVQLVALCALVAASVPLVAGAVSATHAELLRPSIGGPLYERVLSQLGGPLYLLLGVLVVVEAASAVATRRLLAGAHGQGVRTRSPLTAVLVGLGRPVLRPIGTLGTALLGWLTSAGLLLPVLLMLDAAWRAARGALLAQPSAAGGEEVGALVAVLAMCGAWLGALALAGVASAVRAALWTSQEQH